MKKPTIIKQLFFAGVLLATVNFTTSCESCNRKETTTENDAVSGGAGLDDTYGNDTIMSTDNSGTNGSYNSGSGTGRGNTSGNTNSGTGSSSASGTTNNTSGSGKSTSGTEKTTTVDPNNDPIENSNYNRNKSGNGDGGGSAGTGSGTGTGSTGNNSRVSDPRDQKN